MFNISFRLVCFCFNLNHFQLISMAHTHTHNSNSIHNEQQQLNKYLNKSIYARCSTICKTEKGKNVLNGKQLIGSMTFALKLEFVCDILALSAAKHVELCGKTEFREIISKTQCRMETEMRKKVSL